MFRIGLNGWWGVTLAVSLAACQQVSRVSHPSPIVTSQVKLPTSMPVQGLASLHCSGGAGCEFAKLNQMLIIAEGHQQPSAQAIKAAVVRYEDQQVNGTPAYYIAMPAGMHEVRVRFYPITRQRAERFTLIHNFKANAHYQLNMFRKRPPSSSNQADSLLTIATPDPLCIDLLENDKTIRRFCRPFNPATGLGEFIEQKIPVA